MKKIILIIALFTSVAYSQFKVSEMDSITTLVNTDLFWVNHDVGSSTFAHRQLSWNKLKTNVKSYLLGLSNTWLGIQTFNGATFSSGSHGKVTISDSLVLSSAAYTMNVFPSYVGAPGHPAIGNSSLYYAAVYSQEFIVMNGSGTDSAGITLNTNGNIEFDKPLNITESVNFDSAGTIRVLNFEEHGYNIPTVFDTILTLTDTDKYSFIRLEMPGIMAVGISRLSVESVRRGMIIRFYNNDTSSMIFKDYVGGDDNLYMGGNFTMGQYDFIEFQCISDDPDAQYWIECNRSNN